VICLNVLAAVLAHHVLGNFAVVGGNEEEFEEALKE
jgi:hypothetical protein